MLLCCKNLKYGGVLLCHEIFNITLSHSAAFQDIKQLIWVTYSCRAAQFEYVCSNNLGLIMLGGWFCVKNLKYEGGCLCITKI